MSPSHEATVRLMDEHSAPPEIAAIFNDIKHAKGIDFIPNFWRALAINPLLLGTVWQQLKALMHPESSGAKFALDSRTREIIALAVSATNGCSYCVNSHTAALRKLGVDDAMLGEVLAIVGLFNMTNSLADGLQVRPDVLPPT